MLSMLERGVARGAAIAAALLWSGLGVALAQSKPTLGKADLPAGMQSLVRVSFSGFRADDVIDLSRPANSAPGRASVGEIRDGRLIPRSDAVSFHYDENQLAVSRKEPRDSPVVVVLRLHLGDQAEVPGNGVTQLDPLKQATFTTDGRPAEAVAFPFNGPVVIHDGQILLGQDWLSVTLPRLKIKPVGKPVHLGNGTYRVPGRQIFAAAVEEVKPVIPPDYDWGGVQRDSFVVVRVVIGADGTVRSVERIRGDVELADAVRDALLRWRFAVTSLVPESAQLIETNLPFRFVRPKH